MKGEGTGNVGREDRHEKLTFASSYGAPDWTRTSDPCLRRAVLYPLSYRRCKEYLSPERS